MSLYDDLTEIAQQVIRQQPQMKNSERATIHASVLPFIGALGYNTQDLSEVYPEYAILNMDAVDFAILRDDAPVIFVEAKSAGNKLQNKEWKQLFQYFNAEIGLPFGILTNGVEYRFYTDLNADNIMDKEPFLTLDLLNLDARLVNELEGLTKSDFDPERVVDGARKRVLARLLNQEMNNPSDEIARYFAKQLTTKRLSSNELRYYAGLLREAWQGSVEAETGPVPPIPHNGDDNRPKPTPPPPPTEIPVFGAYEGHRFEATLMIDDRMWLQRADNMLFDGKPMNHAVAALEAVKKVDPSIKKWPRGWIFWRFIDSDTRDERPIKEIFEQVWTRNSSNGY